MKWTKTACYFLMILIIPLISCCNTDKKRFVSKNLRKAVLQKLQEALHRDILWEKVHAAEFLINFGDTGDIYKIFREEEKLKGGVSYFRIGIWRVLVQASLKPDEKQQWLDSIAIAYKTPHTPDRLHAVEALAKLGVSPYIVCREVTDSILDSTHNPMWVFTLWGTAYSSESAKYQVKQKFIRIICSNEESDDVRRLAAYALHHIKGIEKEDASFLLKKATNEPDTSIAFPFILSNALVNISKDSLMIEQAQFCWKKLKAIAATPGAAGRFEALSIFGELGDQEDLPLLTSLIEESNRLKMKESADIALVSSNAILCIDRRQK